MEKVTKRAYDYPQLDNLDPKSQSDDNTHVRKEFDPIDIINRRKSNPFIVDWQLCD